MARYPSSAAGRFRSPARSQGEPVGRRRKRSRRPARRTASQAVHRRILVVCEGRVTEPTYIEGLTRVHRNPLVAVEVAPEHGVPRTLVEAAKRRKARALQHARAHNDENLAFEEVWCVFDVDEHPGLADAVKMARDEHIRLAISSPCFELWLLLHFRDSPGAQDRHTMHRRLAKHLPGYRKHLCFDAIATGVHAAQQRALRLQRDADVDGEPYRNPTSGMFALVASIGRGRYPQGTASSQSGIESKSAS